ncbi:DinB family protein [Paucihalobacter ruber]|uniref:DinB family protein n=1 Tax=Paucihalobacter ruber TaxID=2567861 RepID=A0A506PF66_9FLAO|nr:DinB family protein [Paucihalobacter ruber]TPV32476.1 DinB family protein [Paucihalobacter ruber]
MEKETIIEQLEQAHLDLFNFLENQPNELWLQGPEGKWTTGQQALHLLQSIKALNDALSLPRFFIKYKFGTANRAVRNYDEVVRRYNQRLSEAKNATFKPSEAMKIPPLSDKTYLLNRLKMENKKLQYKTKKLQDKHLDALILPHPLMGKMPVRELLMWTIHHVIHHTNSLKEYYSDLKPN